jgi:transcriptional regulator with XRE-family HTH domain
MDIVLERILSLIPKDPDGKYVHGAKTKFAKKIGYNDGAIVAMWENGSSNSYNKKLYQIADQYHVSVEWLQGKTEDKSIKETPDPEIEGYSELQQAAIQFVLSLPPDKLERFVKMGRAAFEEGK